mmetsp:Transcript_33710/g.107081  ORF Transcript_33710/g.107081 Transcript_33710/m.107081 type:complete len:215 (+) Transcript_33710:76-720(+)
MINTMGLNTSREACAHWLRSKHKVLVFQLDKIKGLDLRQLMQPLVGQLEDGLLRARRLARAADMMRARLHLHSHRRGIQGPLGICRQGHHLPCIVLDLVVREAPEKALAEAPLDHVDPHHHVLVVDNHAVHPDVDRRHVILEHAFELRSESFPADHQLAAHPTDCLAEHFMITVGNNCVLIDELHRRSACSSVVGDLCDPRPRLSPGVGVLRGT